MQEEVNLLATNVPHDLHCKSIAWFLYDWEHWSLMGKIFAKIFGGTSSTEFFLNQLTEFKFPNLLNNSLEVLWIFQHNSKNVWKQFDLFG